MPTPDDGMPGLTIDDDVPSVSVPASVPLPASVSVAGTLVPPVKVPDITVVPPDDVRS